MRNLPIIFLVIIVALTSLWSTACNVVAAVNKPTIEIKAPANNSQFKPGDQVSVSSTSTDTIGIARVELLVDGNLVRADQPINPQSSLVMVQTWAAITGTHTISVRSVNINGGVSDPASIVVQVGAAANAATPSSAAATSACENAAFISDVTIPDGMVLVPGQAINKTWRVRNTGSCPWTEDDQLIFTRGEMASSTKAIAVPALPVGGTVDLTVPILVPTAPGQHSGEWQFRNKEGTIFGTPLTVVVNVSSAAASSSSSSRSPSSTSSSQSSANAACPFLPSIQSFTATPTTIVVGQSATLNWGAVVGAQRAEIDNGIGGVATPGSVTVSPATTTTYTLTATCDNKYSFVRVTVTVR